MPPTPECPRDYLDVASFDLDDLGPHAAWLTRLARGLVQGSAGDDAAQDAWLSAVQHRQQAEEGGRPWLTTVLRNAVRRQWRSDQREGARRREWGASQIATAPSPEDLLDRHQQLTRLGQIVSELDEPFRTTILRRYLEGLTPAQIAARDGIPGGTVRWRLKRGTDEIRRRLDEINGGSRAWVAVLVPSSTLPSANVVDVSWAKTLAQGAFAMKVTTKLLGAVLLLIVFAAGAVLWSRGKPKIGARDATGESSSAERAGAGRATDIATNAVQGPHETSGSLRPGARTLVPRFRANAVAAADAGSPPVRLVRGGGGGPMSDKRDSPGPDATALRAQIMRRLDEAREVTEQCLQRWTAVDPSLEAGVMLAFSLDADGLDEVWLEDRAEVPEGPLHCLSEGIYRIDWAGLTKHPLKVTDKISYRPADAGAP